ncbi:guanine deaminase [Paraliomyxa miuraensis]|uniref:guanine deaminase n=1 Tax=Paraliomyxa miuraensis TaxID=376150 RepID=UPI0022579452|nr:guanine deaminase [Paraliomyxa miuraensis]MCX4246726.1 guanine deaminase [Paraliomyxa miuraensis]
MTDARSLSIVRGRVLTPAPYERKLVEWPDALVEVDADGRITAVSEAPADCPVPPTWPGAVIVPGLVDTHLHFPQTRILGSASGPLLPWLETSVFPEEARFDDPDHAAAVAREMCRALIEQGTTLAGIYSTAHPQATEILLTALEDGGLRAVTGLTLMDRNAPPANRLEAVEAMAASDALIERWHGRDGGRIRISMIPRFALSCTPELLREAGRRSREHDLLLQTHISENRDEIAQTLAAFPGHRDYLSVYEDHDCAGPRTLLAHCIHFSDDEWARMQAQDIAVAHCPDSNFFLGSGCMPLRVALDRGLRVGLGTDVGAGRTFSVRRVAAAAYDASLLCQAMVSPEELLWLATRGGAQAMRQDDRLGCIAPGFDADLVAIDVPPLHPSPSRAALIDALVFRHDAGPVRATVVRGRVLRGA